MTNFRRINNHEHTEKNAGAVETLGSAGSSALEEAREQKLKQASYGFMQGFMAWGGTGPNGWFQGLGLFQQLT